MKFIKKDQLELVNGGYVVEKGTENPVFHSEFLEKQREAHALIMLSQKVKGADFKGTKPVRFEDLVRQVTDEIQTSNVKQYVSEPNKPEMLVTDNLQKEAMSWLNFETDKTTVQKVNKILQKFNIINEFEEFGLYFSTDNISKLNNIYSMQQITEAVTTLEPHMV